MLFLMINIAYIVLPFCLATLHSQMRKKNYNVVQLHFVYFLFFNVFLKAVPIGISAIAWGNNMALENGWQFNPIFAQYGICIATMGLMGFFSVFIRGGFRVATGLMFALFSLFAATLHIIQLVQGTQLVSHNPIILITFDFITAIILFYFIFNQKARGNL